MKLIIDIPKATYDYWKEHKDEYILSEAIANAIPYDDSGDLISRSALKEYVKKVEDYESAYTICAYIDNAPTVCGNNSKWCESCVSKGKCASTKPKDEWICPNCDLYDQVEDDYCQYAGQFTMGCRECRYFVKKGSTK